MISRGTHRMLSRGVEVAGYDVVVPRIGASITDYGLAVLGFFERHGVPSVNSALAIARSRDKLRALQSLSAHDVGIPRTVMARDPQAIRAAVDAVGGTPVIIKLLQGTQGVGVMIAESPQAVESTLNTLWGLGQNIILQEFIAESRGRDLRAVVVGGQLVGAMHRTARAGDFRSNLHRGGAGKRAALDEHYTRAAIEAARIMGLDVAGVDLLESRDGPRVIEVNSSPGLRGIERAAGVDVAARIIEHAERLAREARSTGA
jgi:ribosomal protein S6--L-glutamate ligase